VEEVVQVPTVSSSPVAPMVRVPEFPFPEESLAVVPWHSSNFHQPTGDPLLKSQATWAGVLA